MFSLESLIAWLEDKNPDEVYDWLLAEHCIIGQWLTSCGARDVRGESIRMVRSDPFKTIAINGQNTFGAALERARRIRKTAAKRLETNTRNQMSVWDDGGDDHEGYVTNEIAEEKFKAGAQAMREMLARFVENGGDATTAASIRANWHPGWGKDPGGLNEEIPADCWSAE